MTITVNNVQGNNASSASVTVTISISAGNTVVCSCYGRNGGSGLLGTVTDSAGNTYTNTSTASIPTTFTQGMAYSLAIASSITSVTYTPPATAGQCILAVWDVSATGALSLAGSNSNSYNFNSTTGIDAITTGLISGITSTDAMLFAGMLDGSSGNPAAGTGFTFDYGPAFSSVGTEHKAVSASAPATFTDATGAGHLIVIAGLALQVAAGPTNNATIAWVT